MSLRDTVPTTDPDDAAFEAILSYDWDADQEFQAGVQALLTGTAPAQADDLLLQAKCYYYSRTSQVPISFDLFKSYLLRKHGQPTETPDRRSLPAAHGERTNPSLNPATLQEPNQTKSPQMSSENPPPESAPVVDQSASSPSATENADSVPYPTSFAHIVELITTGQPIPGIREIPNKLSEDKPSESVKSRRKKPWEIHASQNEVQASAMSGEL